MSLTREVRLLSGVSALRVATDPSTLMSTVVHRGSLLHTDRALSQLGLTPVLELEHCIRQAPLDQEAPTKASRSLSHGKSSPEKRPSPRVTRPEKATLLGCVDETASLGCVQSRGSTRFLFRDDWPTHFRNRLPVGALPVVKLRARSHVQLEVQRINSASHARAAPRGATNISSADDFDCSARVVPRPCRKSGKTRMNHRICVHVPLTRQTHSRDNRCDGTVTRSEYTHPCVSNSQNDSHEDECSVHASGPPGVSLCVFRLAPTGHRSLFTVTENTGGSRDTHMGHTGGRTRAHG